MSRLSTFTLIELFLPTDTLPLFYSPETALIEVVLLIRFFKRLASLPRITISTLRQRRSTCCSTDIEKCSPSSWEVSLVKSGKAAGSML